MNIAIVNGRIRTMGQGDQLVEAVMVEDGRVQHIGDSRSIEEYACSIDAPIIDAEGKSVLPGFVDGHCHLEMTCASVEAELQLQSPEYSSLAEIAQAIGEYRSTNPSGWLTCRGSFGLQHKVAEGRLFHREELDRVSPDAPVAVLAGLHVAMLNSVALKHLGISGTTPADRGIIVEVDRNGNATGVVTELWDAFPTHGQDVVREGLRRNISRLFTSHGVTSVSTIPTSPEDTRALWELYQENDLRVRVNSYPHVPRFGSIREVLSSGLSSGMGNDMLSFGGIKVFIDGISGDAYGSPLDDTKWLPGELRDLLDYANSRDVQVLMHVESWQAALMAANAINRVCPGNPLKHRLEHGADYLDATSLKTVYQSGLVIVGTPQFTKSNLASQGGPPALYREAIDQGFEIVGGSDSTGTVPESSPPLYNISCAVNRDTNGREVDTSSVTVEEGLRMFTTWSADGLYRGGNDIGRIQVGSHGDIVILSDDLFEIGHSEIAGLCVEKTILGGNIVYES